MTSAPFSAPVSRPLSSVLVAVAVMGVVAIALCATAVAARDDGAIVNEWDEGVMQPIVAAIVEDGWTVSHTIDYQDTKGPAFFWLYAAVGEVVGRDVDDLRLITIGLFLLTGIPLGLLAARFGLTPAQTAAAAALYALLPYNAVLGQLFMSETSFLLGSLIALAVFFRSFDRGPGDVVGPILFGVLLAVLLHHRLHAVVYAGAVVLLATQRDRGASWPWWVACAAAGVSRLPLYVRWDGFVTSEYQTRIGLGFRLDSLSYLAIALLPYTFVLLWPVLTGAAYRRRRWWLGAGAAAGLLLGLVAVPDFLAADVGKPRFMGPVASTLKPFTDRGILPFAVALLCMLGVAAIAAVGVLGFGSRGGSDSGSGFPRRPLEAVTRLAAWMIVLGWLLQGLTRGVVYDRYLLPFVILLPFVYVDRLPRWLLSLQAIGFAALLLRQALDRLV